MKYILIFLFSMNAAQAITLAQKTELTNRLKNIKHARKIFNKDHNDLNRFAWLKEEFEKGDYSLTEIKIAEMESKSETINTRKGREKSALERMKLIDCAQKTSQELKDRCILSKREMD